MNYKRINLLIVLVSLFLSACYSEPKHVASLGAFLRIIPGQSSQAEVQKMLGGPDFSDDDIDRIYWDYYAPDNEETVLRTYFATDTMRVTLVELYDNTLLVQDLIDQFGEPYIVFQVDSSENFGNDVYLVQFAYPEQGIYADIYNPIPSEKDALFSIWRKAPSNPQEYKGLIETSSQKQIIDWP